MFFDTHVHFESLNGQDGAESVISRAIETGTDKMIIVGGSDIMNHTAIESTALFPRNTAAAIGLDRDQAEAIADGTAELNTLTQSIRSLVLNNRSDRNIAAIGEIGLDYHYSRHTAPSQIELFRAQLQLSGELGLPSIIHSRESDDDTLKCLDACLSVHGGVMHCFSGSEDFAKKTLELGLYISFSGVITFKNAENLRKIARMIPAEKILIETDTPYLAPVPHRGKRNEPAFVEFIAKTLAEIRGCSIEEIGELTTRNAQTLFNL